MSIYAITLSKWIDKANKKACEYYNFVKTFQGMKCRNHACNRKLDYSMVDLHSAPFGMGDGPFCSMKCYVHPWDNKPPRKETSRTRRWDRISKEKILKMRRQWEEQELKLNIEDAWDE